MIAMSFIAGAALLLGLYAAICDFKGLKIPNWISLAVFGLFITGFAIDTFFGFGFFKGTIHYFIVGSVILVVTMLLFFTGFMGGGDSKMMSAFAFWAGAHSIVPFLFWMAVAGGVLGLIAIISKKLNFQTLLEKHQWLAKSWVGQMQSGRNAVPYGIAICIGAMAGFYDAGYFNL